MRVLEEGGETNSEVLYMKGNLLKDMNKLDDAIRARLVRPQYFKLEMNSIGLLESRAYQL